jgi:hypothetical protein
LNCPGVHARRLSGHPARRLPSAYREVIILPKMADPFLTTKSPRSALCANRKAEVAAGFACAFIDETSEELAAKLPSRFVATVWDARYLGAVRLMTVCKQT